MAAAADPANKTELKKRLAQLLKRNKASCADCPDKRPTWGSIIKPHGEAPIGSESLVAFVCFQCAGIHRRLGTHVCFVRSVSLDDWSIKEVQAAEASGNDVVNRIYEAIQSNATSGTAVNIKPLAGAHVATRERYIRSKYVDLLYYSKSAHNDFLNQLQVKLQQASSPTKSPLKKLGMFLSNENASLLKKVGSKSVGSSTYESSGDDKSFLSAPVPSTSSRSSNSSNGSTSQSVCPQPVKQLKKGRRPDLSGSGAMKNRFDESIQSLKFDGKGGNGRARSNSIGGGSNNNSFQNNSNHASSTSLNLHGCQEKLPSGSGHGGFLEKQAPVHKDPRRAAFHNSKNGFDISPEELTSDSNHKPKSFTRPTLVSANPIRNNLHNSNSRMNLYLHGGGRERSTSRSRKRDSSLDAGKRHRSSSRGRNDINGGNKSNSRGRRGRSKSANKDHDIKAAGLSQRTRERSESRARARSSSRQRGTGPSNATISRRPRGQSQSRQSKSVEPAMNRFHQSSSQLLQLFNEDPLKSSNHSKSKNAIECKVIMIPGKDRDAPQRSKSEDLSGMTANGEDLSGMILIFDESSKTLDFETSQRKQRRRSSSRTRSQSTEQHQKSYDKQQRRKSRSQSREQKGSHRSSSRRAGSSRSLWSDVISISPVRTKMAHPSSSPSPSRRSRSRRSSSLGRKKVAHPSGSPSPSKRGRSSREVSHNEGENASPVQIKDQSRSRGRSSSRSLAKHEAEHRSSSRRVSTRDKDVNLSPEKTSPSSRSLQVARQSSSRKKLDQTENKGSPRSMRMKSKNPSPTTEKKPSPKKPSPRKTGEGDFQIISSKTYSLAGKGSNHSSDNVSFAKPYKGRLVGSGEGTIKDKRRCSRTAMASRIAQRQSRKSDIFASMDREEGEQTKPSGPLLRHLPQRSKSGDNFFPSTKSKLMIRKPAPARSKSMELQEMAKPAPELDLGLELGSGHNNDALLKAWETRTSDTSHKLAVFDETTRVKV